MVGRAASPLAAGKGGCKCSVGRGHLTPPVRGELRRIEFVINHKITCRGTASSTFRRDVEGKFGVGYMAGVLRGGVRAPRPTE